MQVLSESKSCERTTGAGAARVVAAKPVKVQAWRSILFVLDIMSLEESWIRGATMLRVRCMMIK